MIVGLKNMCGNNIDIKNKIKYLEQFYSINEIEEYTKFDNNLISLLFEKTQPREVSIKDLKDVLTNKSCYFVNSPDGWVRVNDWVEKPQKPVYEVLFSNNKVVKASHDHLFQKFDLSWVSVENLQFGDMVISDNGMTSVVKKEFIGKHDVYDLSVDHDNHRYYTNGICSHNTGKSLFLQNLALNWVQMGLDVIYISLEISEELIGMRMNAMIVGRPTKEVIRDSDETSKTIKTIHNLKKWGNLTIKFMPIGTTANNIKSYIKEYEIQKNKKPDCLLVDYLDLLHPNSKRVDASNLFVKDKYVSEEMRSLMNECGLLGATASQLNRCLTLDTVVEDKKRGKIPIKDICIGDEILSNTGFVSVKNVHAKTTQPVYKIKTKSGKVIKCSGNHFFPTKEGLKSIETGLRVGDIVYVKREDIRDNKQS